MRVPPEEYSYSASLFLDGRDVTEVTQVAVFMTHPRSMVQISYAPDPPLSSGEHSAVVEYSDERGLEWSYGWGFFVD